MKHLRLERIILFGVAAILFACLTHLVGPKNWYGSDARQIPHRLQSDALLNGKLSLAENPWMHDQDLCWGNGLQQNWGLGVALIRLPFEFLSHLLFDQGFPDRLVLLFAFLLIIFCLHKLLFDFGLSRIERCLLPLLCTLNPPILRLLTHSFNVYEETIFYGFIFSLFLFCVTQFQTKNSNRFVLFLSGVVMGLGPWIRPTIVFYSIACLCLMFLKLRGQTKNLSILSGGFAVSILSLLVLNILRFGAPLEFGYSMNLSMMPLNDYALRFESLYSHESFFPALREFFGNGFFLSKPVPGIYFAGHSISSYSSGTFRFREFTQIPFAPYELLILLLGCIVPFVFNKSKDSSSLKLFALWTGGVFTVLTLFYLRAPSMVWRYYLDFAPVIVVAGLTLYLSLPKTNVQWRYSLALVLIATGFWMGKFQKDSSVGDREGGTWERVSKVINKHHTKFQASTFADIPDVQNCPDNRPDSPLHLLPTYYYSWDFAGSCRPKVLSSHFLRGASCVRLHMTADLGGVSRSLKAKIESIPEESRFEEMLSWIRIKRNLELMSLTDKSIQGSSAYLTFCGSKPAEKNQIYLMSIGWLKTEDIETKNVPFKLLSLESVE